MPNSQYLKHAGTEMLIAEAKVPLPDGGVKDGLLAIRAQDLKRLWQRGQRFAIIQLYKLVIPGIILSKHIFQGLRRPLLTDGLPNADKTKWIYSRRPQFDWMPSEPTDGGADRSARTSAPEGKVFVVIVSPNERHQAEFPMVDGWLDHWNWVQQDDGLAEAPSNWLERYDRKVWSLQ
jgi:hypothetical protein